MLFRNRFSTPGPGVEAGAPRKTGLPRLWELLSRDLSSLYKASFLGVLGSLPALLLVGFGIFLGSAPVVLAAALATGWLVGPCLCGAFDTTLRALRDEPGYWWLTYRRAFKANFKGCLLSGIVFTGVVGLQVLACTALLQARNGSVFTWVALILTLILTTGFYTYYWAQMALMDLSLSQRVKNSCFMFIGFLPRTLAASLCQLAYWAAVYLLLPAGLVLLLFLGCWLPLLLGLLLVYPSMDGVLHIEEALARKNQDRYAGQVDWGEPRQ